VCQMCEMGKLREICGICIMILVDIVIEEEMSIRKEEDRAKSKELRNKNLKLKTFFEA